MIKFLTKRTIKDSDKTHLPHVREAYCVLGGILGILCNLFLFIIKLIIGSIMGSIAIISDAFNNLSDTGSSLVSIIGAKLSNKKPDKEHPFGHGRLEYVSSMIVSFIIMLVGFELLKSSFTKVLNPAIVLINPVLTLILLLSILVKIWMYSYNKYLGKKIDSSILRAASKDSLNDAISTLAVIITAGISSLTNILWLDGVVGIFVSLIIMKSGYDIARDTIGVLLGSPPDKECVNKIIEIISSGEDIAGVHDLIVHDYGPGRIMASVHAEVPDNADIVRTHEIIDMLEKQIENEMGIHMVIHMDPISVDCARTKEIKDIILSVIKGIDPVLNIHDFRMTDGESQINLIFDLEVPAGFGDRDSLPLLIDSLLKKEDERFMTVISMDTVYN